MDQRAEADLHSENGNWLARHRLKLVTAILKSNGISDRSRVIDLGAGSGFGVTVLSQFTTCDALEPSSFFVDSIRRQSSARRVFQDVIPPEVPHDFDTYDAAVLMDVLEHLSDESGALLWIRTILRSSDSKLVVTVPAYQWMFSYHDVSVHHFRRYSRKTLVRELTRAGFVVENVTYFVTLLFLFALIARAMGVVAHRFRKEPPKKARSSVNPSIDRLFAKVCDVERQILKRSSLPFGLSLVAVCSRGPSA